jgi:hypothetical protein
MIATSVFVGATPALASGCPEPGNPNCTIWASPICNERVPKAIRVAAGCFDIQP